MRVDRGITNFLQLTNFPLFRGIITHPSFGIWWHEVPPPNLTNNSDMAAVNAFIATNGWKMHKGQLSSLSFRQQWSIRGLPWKEIRDRDFLALTHNGILYVMLTGFHHNLNGVAYNPQTNPFPDRIQGFKSLGGHWYAWIHPEDWPLPGDPPLRQEYEGKPR